MNSFDFRLHVLRNWYLHERLFYVASKVTVEEI